MYLVTGGGGFIGSHLVRVLVQKGLRVRVLDDSSSGSRKQIADVADAIEWVDGDLRDDNIVRQVCRGVEVVLHHAAIASVPQSIAHPAAAHAVNVTGTLDLLIAARDAGVRRFVFASSSAVYGDLPDSPKNEDLPVQPVSPYGVQKLAAESYCRIWHALYGLETVALRYFNVFGPGQSPTSEYAAVIPRFITAVLGGHAPTIFGDGEQSRDFVYVGNVVDVNLLAATLPNLGGEVLNVGMGGPVTLNQLVGQLERIVGRPIRPTYAPVRPGDIRESVADISRLQSTLHHEPSTSFEDGLAATVEAFEGVRKRG